MSTQPLILKSIEDTGKPSSPIGETRYKTTPYRWCVLAVCAAHLAMNTLIICTLSPAAVELTRAFGLNSTVWVNLAAMSVAICSVPFSFVAIWAFKKFPTSHVLRTASAVFLGGALIRMYGFTVNQYWPILAGTTVSATAAPFFLNVQSVTLSLL